MGSSGSEHWFTFPELGVSYLGELDGEELLELEVHQEAVHKKLVVDVPRSCK